MGLLDWWGRREGSRPALSSSVRGVIGGDWPPPYDQQVREGYCRNPVAQRAVRVVADALAGAPIDASDPVLAALIGRGRRGSRCWRRWRRR